MQIRQEIKDKIVLALDVDDINQAKSLITELKDYVGVFKVGLQLFTGNGLEIFKFMKEQNIKFFFDVKLHDIPNTVAKASENIIRNGASFFNIHTTGGEEMMRKAREAARKTARYNKRCLAGVLPTTIIYRLCLPIRYVLGTLAGLVPQGIATIHRAQCARSCTHSCTRRCACNSTNIAIYPPDNHKKATIYPHGYPQKCG